MCNRINFILNRKKIVKTDQSELRLFAQQGQKQINKSKKCMLQHQFIIGLCKKR